MSRQFEITPAHKLVSTYNFHGKRQTKKSQKNNTSQKSFIQILGVVYVDFLHCSKRNCEQKMNKALLKLSD